MGSEMCIRDSLCCCCCWMPVGANSRRCCRCRFRFRCRFRRRCRCRRRRCCCGCGCCYCCRRLRRCCYLHHPLRPRNYLAQHCCPRRSRPALFLLQPPTTASIGYHAVSFPRSCVSCRPGMEVLACPHPLDSSSLPASRQGLEERSHADFHPGQIAAVRQRPPSSSHGRHGQHVFVSCLFFEVRRTPLGRRWGSSSSTAVLPYYHSVRSRASSSSTAVLHHSAESRRIQPPYRSLIGLYYGVLWGGTVQKKKKRLNGSLLIGLYYG